MNFYKLLISLLALALPLTSFSQSPELIVALEDQDTDEETVYLSPFEVTSDRAAGYRATDSIGGARIRRALIDTPATINVVTRELLDDLGATSIIEATQYISGVGYGALGGANGIFTRQVLRGFEIWENTIDNITNMGGFAANVDPLLVERIEILKGPNALLSPSGAPGGTSNLIIKSPQFKQSTEVKATFATKFFGNQYGLDTTGPIPGTQRFAYRIIASHQNSSSFIPGRIINKTLNPQVAWAISDKTRLTFKGNIFKWQQTGSIAANQHNLHMRDDFPIGGTVSTADIKPGFIYGGANGQADWTTRASTIARGTLDFTTALTDHLNLRIAGLRHYYHFYGNTGGLRFEGWGGARNPFTGEFARDRRWTKVDPTAPYDPVSNPFTETVMPLIDSTVPPQVREGLQHNWIHESHYQFDLAGKWDIGERGGRRLLGVQAVVGASNSHSWDNYYLRDVRTGWEEVLDYDFSQPYPSMQPRATPNGTARSWSQGKTLKGATKQQFYVNTSFDFFEGKLLVGGGISHQKSEGATSLNELNDVTTKGEKSSKNNPSGNLLYKVFPWASTYVSVSQNATLSGYWDGSMNQPIWRDGKQNEFGAKFEFFDRRFGITTSYFELRQTNVATQHEMRWLDESLPDSLNDITNKGFELDITGKITANLSVLGSYTSMKMRDQFNRRRMGIPDDMYNGIIRYSFLNGWSEGLNIWLGFNHVGTQAGENPPERTEIGIIPAVSFWMPSRTIYNAGIGYTYQKASIQVNIENLFNKKTVWQPGGWNQLTPFPETNVRLTLGYNF